MAPVCVLGDISLTVLCPHLCHCRSKSEMSYILVQSHMDLSENVCCDFPFSWKIKDYLEELWAQAQYITEAGGELRSGCVPAGESLEPRPGSVTPLLRLLDSQGPKDSGDVLSWAFLNNCWWRK